MARFLALTLFLVIAAGLALHQGVQLSYWGDWIGKLPGDLIVKKNGIAIFLPFTSAFLASGALSFLLSFFSSGK